MPKQTRADKALQLAANLEAAERLDEAATVLYEALRHDNGGHALDYRLAMIEARRGNWADAERLARSAALSGGDRYSGGLGAILATVGKHDEACQWLHRAIASDPRDASAHLSLARVFADQGRLDEALAWIDRALAIQPDIPSARRNRDRISAEQRFLRSARTAFLTLAQDRSSARGADADGSTELEFPSASLDAEGRPRFVMTLPERLVANDLGAAHLFLRETGQRGYEFGLRRFLDVHLMSDDVFIDVGAHWGIHSLTAATRWPGQVSVIAIEAHPENRARLTSWVTRNDLAAGVEVVDKAAGDREGLADMRVNASSMGHTLRHVDAPAPASCIAKVAITTLDKLMAERAQLRWRRVIMKIDVEGCEMDVLKGARELFASRSVAAVIWEKGSFHARIVQDRLDKAIFDFLDAHGYEHFYMENEEAGGRLLPLTDRDRLCNVYSVAKAIRLRESYG
jgi:FkbM family methyltransferase